MRRLPLLLITLTLAITPTAMAGGGKGGHGGGGHVARPPQVHFKAPKMNVAAPRMHTNNVPRSAPRMPSPQMAFKAPRMAVTPNHIAANNSSKMLAAPTHVGVLSPRTSSVNTANTPTTSAINRVPGTSGAIPSTTGTLSAVNPYHSGYGSMGSRGYGMGSRGYRGSNRGYGGYRRNSYNHSQYNSQQARLRAFEQLVAALSSIPKQGMGQGPGQGQGRGQGNLAGLAANTGTNLHRHLMAVAEHNPRPNGQSVTRLSGDLTRALHHRQMATWNPVNLAADIKIAMNGAHVGQGSVHQAIRGSEHALRTIGVDQADTRAVAADLRAVAMGEVARMR